MTHVVVTIMDYPDNSEFEKRIELYREMVLPRLLSQTDRNFDIAVQCHPRHKERVKQLNRRIIAFTKKPSVGMKWPWLGKWNEVDGLDKYDIQTSVDSDDWVSKEFVAKIHEAISKQDLTKSLHISFQPELLNLETGQTKKMRTRYSPTSGSMFFSIYQPDKENYIYIGEHVHNEMQRYFSKSITLPEGDCWMCIHKENRDSTMNS